MAACSWINHRTSQSTPQHYPTPSRRRSTILVCSFRRAVFPFLTGFLQRGQCRLLKLATQKEERWVNADECGELANNTFGWSKVASKPKNASPTKRSRQVADVEDIDELKEDAAGRSKWKKTQDSRSDDGLSSTENQARPWYNKGWNSSEHALTPKENGRRSWSGIKVYWITVAGLSASELPRYFSVIGGDMIPSLMTELWRFFSSETRQAGFINWGWNTEKGW